MVTAADVGVAAAPAKVAAAVAMVAVASVAAAAFVTAAAAAVGMAACLPSAPAAVRFAHARTAANFPDLAYNALAYNARSSLAGSLTYAVSGEHYCCTLLWAVCMAG